MKLYQKIIIISLILFVFITAYIMFLFFLPKQVNEVLVEIKKGETALSIAQKLSDHRVIRSKNSFYVFIKLTKSDGILSYGKYLFKGKLALSDVIDTIKSGKVVLRKVTIPEGLSVRKTCKLLAKEEFGDFQQFLDICNDPQIAKQFTGFSISSLEGFLYPETYHFPEGVSEKYIISHLVKSFFSQTADLNFVPDEILSFYNVIILASIVECEARIEKEKPTIASVYLNRLNYHYKLQADPTIAYALEEQDKTRKKIYYKDLSIDSPYNTYKHYGLPPTPICNPSVTSIQAVLEPEETDYFFFFATGTGQHEFTKTYDQHINQQRIIKKNNGK
ncbi:MAG: endolytic transglycosylase MltG [Candidatus Cloacimonetes bacterium]|nr:endolytic transglycosylase MltG [Candidatus Cloacimonadota bacterium]